MNRKRLTIASISVIGIIVVFAISLIGACGAPEKEETLMFGQIQPLSGPAAPWGISSDRGMKMAVDEVNAQGGIVIGNTCYTIGYIVLDNKMTSEGGLEAATKLVFDHNVKFMPYSLGSGPSLAAQTVTEPAKVLFGTSAMTKDILGPDKPYSFRVQMGDNEWAPALHGWLREEYPNVKREAILNRDDAWGRDATEFALLAAEQYGFEVVYSDWFKLGTQDFAPMLAKMIASDPDFLYCTGAVIFESALIAKQARELGFKKPIIVTGGEPTIWFQIVSHEASENAIAAATHLWSQEDPRFTPEQKAFAAKYEELYDEPMLSALPAQAYDATMIFIEAIKRAKSIDPDKVKEELEKGEFDVLQGHVYFAGEEDYGIKHQIMMPLPIYRYDTTTHQFRLVNILSPD